MLTELAANRGTLQNSRKRSNLRWFLPLLFIVGYLATAFHFGENAIEYAFLTSLSVAACCLLLSRLERSIQNTLIFWLVFAVLILGYYVKFYWITVFPEVGAGYILLDAFAFSATALFSAYTTTTYAFVTFCVTAWFLLGLSDSKDTGMVTPTVMSDPIADTRQYRFAGSLALNIALILIPVTTVTMYIAGIAVMGVEGPSLPFRLAGMVFYTRSVFIPAMLLLQIWCSQQARLPKKIVVGVMLLVVFGLSDMLLRSSRGGLLTVLFSLGMLFLLSGYRLSKRHLLFFASGLMFVAFLYPIVSDYRQLRVYNPSGDIRILFADAANAYSGELGAFFDIFASGINALLMRITGVDMLIVYNGLGIQPLGDAAWYVFASPPGMGGYVTVDVFGFSPNATTAVAPALVGWFYLIGGNAFTVIGMVAFTFIIYVLWRMLIRLRLQSLPVAQALFLSLLLVMATEGTLDTIVALPVVAWPVSIAICEWLVRIGKSTRRNRSIALSGNMGRL